MPDVKFTVDGKQLTAPAGTLLIEACKSAGIEVPAFCYYPGLSVQGACRMCLCIMERRPNFRRRAPYRSPREWLWQPTLRRSTKPGKLLSRFCLEIILSIVLCATRAANAN